MSCISARLAKEGQKVLRGRFSVITTAMVAWELNRRAPRVDPPAHIRLGKLWLSSDFCFLWLLGGATGSGKTYAAIQAASNFANSFNMYDGTSTSVGCVLYYSVTHDDGHKSTVPQHLNWAEDQNAFREALATQDLQGLLAMMQMLHEKHACSDYYADIFAKYVERVCEKCTTLFEDLKHTAEAIRVAVVLDDVGDKPYFEVAARSCSKWGLREKLGLSDSVELAVVLCGTRIEQISYSCGSLPPDITEILLTPTSAETLWAALLREYPEVVRVADRVSPTCRAMGRSNALMGMLLLECLTEGLQQPLDADYANAAAAAEAVARQAAMRFKEMTAFRDADRTKMLELYGQALRTCLWHTDVKKRLEHPELLGKYGVISDLRRMDLMSDRLVAATDGVAKGRCFTMAPAMAAFFRIMLSDDCLVPMGATRESFEHAMVHFVGAALRSCAGRSVRDFLSLIVTDATTIPNNSNGNSSSDDDDDLTLTIPSDIDETLLMLSLGRRKFDEDSVGRALRLTTTGDGDKEARATKEVLDLAFTTTPATTTTKRRVRTRDGERKEHTSSPQAQTLTAKCPVVLLNGGDAAAADIVVIVPGVLVCHVLCDDSPDRFTTEGGQPKMVRNRYLTEPLQYCVVVTTAPPETKLAKAIPKPKDMPLLLMHVQRDPDDGDGGSNCAFLQSLVGLCKAADDARGGMIVQGFKAGMK